MLIGETFKHHDSEYRVVADLRPAHDVVMVERADLRLPDGGPIRSYYQARLAAKHIVLTREA